MALALQARFSRQELFRVQAIGWRRELMIGYDLASARVMQLTRVAMIAMMCPLLSAAPAFAQPILPPVQKPADLPAAMRHRAGPALQFLVRAADVLAQRGASPKLLNAAQQIASDARADIARLGVTGNLPRVPWGAKLAQLRKIQTRYLHDRYLVDARNALHEIKAVSFAFDKDGSDASVRATAHQMLAHVRDGERALRGKRF